ncbi:hypothetical protein BW054_004780 [Salmonella enterica subsp. enterica serovar Javiana]|uniref:Uncharacterized protein n=23 Tax=Enterobacteriaceae TaxID=543 RepID=A0A2A3VS45_ECOLX|nr:orf; hypothetical protein [Salmonella enterica subsp. enterica serovar Typhi]ASO45336.1 hypothetical protein CHD02_25675 [Salmonella enterica subsp. enterica serovar Derby]ASZ39824.1 hypothetical protein CK947_25415 [Salmonella enterica subsp. enterica serovar Saintpaul]AUW39370.1 hypothetical protein AL551_28195 [Escherichia coli]AWS98794.1 hypothetical protein AN232_26860 [Citrobacter sp. CRE-46]AXD16916.1 hypothetical protein CHC58_25315 [Salmonella enterica]EAA0826858.1 hypothetical pr
MPVGDQLFALQRGETLLGQYRQYGNVGYTVVTPCVKQHLPGASVVTAHFHFLFRSMAGGNSLLIETFILGSRALLQCRINKGVKRVRTIRCISQIGFHNTSYVFGII